jgi:hypothetical protein
MLSLAANDSGLLLSSISFDHSYGTSVVQAAESRNRNVIA